MTSGFEQQDTLANLAFMRAAAQPRQIGVKLPEPLKPAPAKAAGRASEPRTF